MAQCPPPTRSTSRSNTSRRRREGTAKKHPNTCPGCGSHYRDEELARHLRVCPQCGHHFPVRALERIEQLADAGSFEEDETHLRSDDPLTFFDLKPYTERLAEAEVSTGLGDAMITGTRDDRGRRCRLAVMDFSFMGGSMGSVVGEKFARACEHAAEDGVPLVSVSASGGARMQEGILALMQLPKTVCARRGAARCRGGADLGAHAPDHGRAARELRLARRRAPRRARSADVVRRPAGCRADDAREAARRLRAGRVQPPFRAHRRRSCRAPSCARRWRS